MFFSRLRKDIEAAKRNDPAARNKFEIWLTYSGVHALSWHRFANRLYKMHLRLLARWASQFAKFLTGIEIHPAAKIAPGVFIDHGMGVVIGETAEVEEGVVIYQGVTLGGTGKERGKRHPTIKKNVTVSSGANVRINGEKTQDLIPEKDDPVMKEVSFLRERIFELEERLEKFASWEETHAVKENGAAARDADAEKTAAQEITTDDKEKQDENL